jgi:outer membrane lipoprotein-sorting protein
MNKLAFLLVTVALFSLGCAQESNKEQASAVNNNDVHLVIEMQSLLSKLAEIQNRNPHKYWLKLL